MLVVAARVLVSKGDVMEEGRKERLKWDSKRSMNGWIERFTEEKRKGLIGGLLRLGSRSFGGGLCTCNSRRPWEMCQ